MPAARGGGGGGEGFGELPSIPAFVAASGEGSPAEEAEYARVGGKVLEGGGGEDEDLVRSGVPSISLMMYDGGDGGGRVVVVVGELVLRRV